MKKLVLIMIVSGAIIKSSMAQFDSISTKTPIKYGVKLGNFNTESCYNTGFEGSIFVESKGRLLSMGFFYNAEKNKIAGLSVNHQIRIGKSMNKGGITIEKFFFYNFLIITTTLKTSDISNSLFQSMYVNSKVISMEHHIGIGCKMGLTNNIYLDAAIGYGRYLGTVRNASQPTVNYPIYKGGNGWGTLTKINISYYL